jgi:hypothetical protein
MSDRENAGALVPCMEVSHGPSIAMARSGRGHGYYSKSVDSLMEKFREPVR